MPDMIEFDITGAAEMEKLLKELGPKVSSKIGDQALRRAARVIVNEAKRNIRVRSGDLKRSITAVIQRRGIDEDERVILIGFKPPHSRRAHLLEYGTSHSRPFPFMRPALDSKVHEVLTVLGSVLAKGIEEEALKLAKPGKR